MDPNLPEAIGRFLAETADLHGVADLEALALTWPDLWDNLPGRYPRGISIGTALLKGVLDTVRGGPNPLYFSHYRQVNNQLDRTALALAAFIERAGYAAVPIPASQLLARGPVMRAHLCHRRVAWQAGLGMRGLNNLLVTPRFGAAVRLATVLTDMPLPAAVPVEEGCDRCGLCRDACPSGAIGATPADFDLARCRAKLDEFSRIPFVAQHVCGVCQSACRGHRTAEVRDGRDH
ncbi:MAG: 4Fe-4S binding protein [Planctomycetota bacterium]